MESNKTMVLNKMQDFQMENRTIPEPEKDDVLLRINSVGICGSDVHYWWHGRCGRFKVDKPIVLGHESSATVVKCGSEVTHLRPGDRVAIEPGIPCRRCFLCKIGRYNICPEVRFCATPPVDGTLCQFYVHPADFCFKLPAHVSDEEGAMLEPLAVAVYSCRRAEVTQGSKVLITGAGPIGLVSLLVARALGAASICLTDINDSRLKFAKELGASSTVNVRNLTLEAAAAEVTKVMGGQPEAVIECCGADMSYKMAVLVGAPRCIIVTVGRGQQEVDLPLVALTAKEMDIRGIFRYANCYPVALEMVQTGQVDVKPLVTHRYSLDNVEDAFHAAKAGEAIKVMIKVDQTK